MKNQEKKEYQVIMVNPERCSDCDSCMTICAFVHEKDYIPLERRVVGKRKRIELEWAISCDLCQGAKVEFLDPEIGKQPQCIPACPHQAIFVGTIDSLGNESRINAIKRAFNEKS
jgi:Fe-S-cluster-containing dehydrogenase component